MSLILSNRGKIAEHTSSRLKCALAHICIKENPLVHCPNGLSNTIMQVASKNILFSLQTFEQFLDTFTTSCNTMIVCFNTGHRSFYEITAK